MNGPGVITQPKLVPRKDRDPRPQAVEPLRRKAARPAVRKPTPPVFFESLTTRERHRARPVGIRPLFRCWDDIARRVRAAKDIRLFLDFDGTLVDFRARPEQVTLGDEVRAALEKLVKHKRLHAVMVSGRRRASLMQHIHVPKIEYFGLYGWENAEGLHVSPAVMRTLSRARVKLGDLPNKAPGIYIEDKGLSLAVHFREASPRARSRARAELHKWLAQFRSDLHIIRASNVWELAPRQIRGKGIAVRKMLKDVSGPFLPFYVGDDLTDESAFAALRGGITVLVGPLRATNAHFLLRNSDEVCTFIQRLEAELS